MHELRAKVIIKPSDNWASPQCGTPTQHRAIIRMAQGLGYSNMPEFLKRWFNYEINREPDGSLRPLQVHMLFIHHRKGLLPFKGSPPRTRKLYKEWQEKNAEAAKRIRADVKST